MLIIIYQHSAGNDDWESQNTTLGYAVTSYAMAYANNRSSARADANNRSSARADANVPS